MPKSDPDFGPLMSALPEKERDFIVHLFECDNAAQAARLAGFGSPESKPDAMKVIGHRLRTRPRIVEAMQEYAKSLIRSEGPGALMAVREVMGDPREPVARLRAANMIFERIDPTTTKLDVNVKHTFDPIKVTIEWLIELKKSGWTREQLLTEFTEFELAHYEGLIAKQKPAMIDVTPQVVEDDDDLSELLKV